MTSEHTFDAAEIATPPDWISRMSTPGFDVLVPTCFHDWDPVQQEGYLAQRRVNAAEAEVVTIAYDCVRQAEWAEADDPVECAATTLGAAMSLPRMGASRLVVTAIEMTERLPRTFALLAAGWIGLAAAHVIAEETRLVDDERIGAVDRAIAEQLAPTRRRTHPPRFGPLRKMAVKAVATCDPVGAEARARAARGSLDVGMRPVENDLAVLSARLTADAAVEIMERLEALVRTAAADDSRSVGQLRAAGLLALTRGWTSLPDPDGSLPGEPHAASGARQVVLHLYEDGGGWRGGDGSGGDGSGDDDEVTDPPSGPPALAGYGPLTRLTGDELEARARRRIENLADLADPEGPGALRYRPSEALRRFCAGRDGTCVFPGCRVPAEDCDRDHIVPFDHDHPERGGRTTSDDLACLCRFHHRLKTEGIWAYYRGEDGGYTWIHGPRHPHRDPGTRVQVTPSGPLARHARPRHPEACDRQRAAAEAGRTGGSGGRVARPTVRERRAADRRRRRAQVEGSASQGSEKQRGAA